MGSRDHPGDRHLYVSDSMGDGAVVALDTKTGDHSSVPGDFPGAIGIAIPFKQANVRISKTAPTTVTQGGTIVFHLRVTNDGPAEAEDVTASDALPQGLTHITASPSGCGVAGRTVTCDLGSLGLGEIRDITVKAHVPFGAAAGTNIENCGTVSSATPSTGLASQDDKKSCTATAVQAAGAGLALGKVGPATALPGPVSYRLTLANHGPGPARDTKIIDKLPPQLTHLAAPDGCTLDGRALTCQVGTLPARQSRMFTVTGTLAPAPPPAPRSPTARP